MRAKTRVRAIPGSNYADLYTIIDAVQIRNSSVEATGFNSVVTCFLGVVPLCDDATRCHHV
jgi:hypothetical protein